jgi:hypothetical protein
MIEASELDSPIDPFELCANCMHSARAHQGSYQGPGTAGCAAWIPYVHKYADMDFECGHGDTCFCERFERIVRQIPT